MKTIWKRFTILLFFVIQQSSASQLLDSAEETLDYDDVSCTSAWNQFRHLCWTPVPLTLDLLDNPQSDLYCQQRGASVLRLASRSFCVRDAARLEKEPTLRDLLGAAISVKNKRIMGNVGY